MTEAIPIEVKKIAYRQSAKDGLVITFAVHPNDMPAELASAPIGTRFMAALVEIGDDEKPVKAPTDHRVKRAGELCRDALFQKYCERYWPDLWEQTSGGARNERTAQVMREVCQVASRKELASDENAARIFDSIVSRFEMWKRGE